MQVSDQPETGVPGMQPSTRLVDGQAANAADAAPFAALIVIPDAGHGPNLSALSISSKYILAPVKKKNTKALAYIAKHNCALSQRGLNTNKLVYDPDVLDGRLNHLTNWVSIPAVLVAWATATQN